MLLLLFSIGAQRCGIDAHWVFEVVPAVELDEPLARYPGSSGGVVRRGNYLPVYDLEKIFIGKSSRMSLSRRIIIVPGSLRAGVPVAGFLAGGVTEAMRAEESSLVRAPLDTLRQAKPTDGVLLVDVKSTLALCDYPIV